MKTVAEVIGVSRSNLVERLQPRPSRGRIGRPPLPDEELVAQIKAAIAELPTYREPALVSGEHGPSPRRHWAAHPPSDTALDGSNAGRPRGSH
jgi:hypothetical protein